MKKFLPRGGRTSDNTWLVLSLLAAIVIVPTACLLWFLSNAVRNERLAARQMLVDAYRTQLALVQEKLEAHWRQKAEELDQLAGNTPGPALFAKVVLEGGVDSAISFDAQGEIAYPTRLAPSGEAARETALAEAVRLERVEQDAAKAAEEFARVARESSDVNVAARALQGQARCLARTSQKEAAIGVLVESLGAERFARARDPQGRLVAANAALMALELIENPSDPRFQIVTDRLVIQVARYDDSTMPASQRHFLMRRLQQLAPAKARFPTFEAEALAARWLEADPMPVRASGLHETSVTNICRFASASSRVVALYRCDKVLAGIQGVLATGALSADVKVTAVPPRHEPAEESLVLLAAGPSLPGWRLALSSRESGLFDTEARRRISTYFWTSFVAVDVMCLLAFVVLRAVRHQAALTRLKNDLVANVTHELKTPLASMRLLVDTLLNSEKLNEQTTREYLELIAGENTRLSRLIDNFLTFSRMERNKHVFDFVEVPSEKIIEGAGAAVRDRFNSPACRLEVNVAGPLPPVLADADALVTALINLLDNAHKYSGDAKQIALSATAKDGRVQFAVSDNGIGLATREVKKVFKRFYQVDQRLSREAGGCGLGLSIVQYIVSAHKGEVRVESEPGRGSTFTITLPAAGKRAECRS